MTASRSVVPSHPVRVESEVLEVRPSEPHPEQGLIEMRTRTLNRNDDAVQVVVANLIVSAARGRNFRQPRVRAGDPNRL